MALWNSRYSPCACVSDCVCLKLTCLREEWGVKWNSASYVTPVDGKIVWWNLWTAIYIYLAQFFPHRKKKLLDTHKPA